MTGPKLNCSRAWSFSTSLQMHGAVAPPWRAWPWWPAHVLFGAAQVQRDEAGAILAPADQPEHDGAFAALRLQLGGGAFQAAAERGRELSRAEALGYAQQISPCTSAPHPGHPNALAALTEREREVAALVARGLTNKQIADALVITKLTADKHVGNILGKLGAASRAQVAVWWVSHAGVPTAVVAA